MEKINIITLGNSGVGKSSLLYRYAKGKFKEHPPTFIDKYLKPTDINGQSINVWLWDTSGQEVFRSITRKYEALYLTLTPWQFRRDAFWAIPTDNMCDVRTVYGYYRLADGVLLVYSVNDCESCKVLHSWLSDFRSVNDSAKIIVVGNMSEDPAKRSEKGIDIVRQLVEEENLEHAEVSAKTEKNVDDTMRYLIERISVATGILDHYNRPECVTSSSAEKTGSLGQGTDNLSRNQQNLDDQVIHLDAETPNKRSCCC